MIFQTKKKQTQYVITITLIQNKRTHTNVLIHSLITKRKFYRLL